MSQSWPAMLTEHINVVRLSFHVLGGLLVASLTWLSIGQSGALTIALAAGVVALVIELGRALIPRFRQSFHDSFGLLMKTEEVRSLTGFTWLVASTIVIAATLHEREAATLGFLVWAFGDATAVCVGRLLGKREILPGLKKTWAGSLAGLTAVVLVSTFTLSAWGVPDIGWKVLAAAGAFFLTETFSKRVGLDDNFTIPLGVAVVVSVL